jgi:hypothetical protein
MAIEYCGSQRVSALRRRSLISGVYRVHDIARPVGNKHPLRFAMTLMNQGEQYETIAGRAQRPLLWEMLSAEQLPPTPWRRARAYRFVHASDWWRTYDQSEGLEWK